MGFDTDVEVRQIQVFALLAADIREQPLTGGIAGSVTSTLFGPLVGVLVAANPGGQTGTTGAGGSYAIGGLTPGAYSVGASGAPASCFRPAPVSVLVQANAQASANFALRCRPIVFAGFTSTGIDVYRVNADGTGRLQLTDDAADNFDPTLSPDGSQIAYIADGELWIMSADGSGKTRVTNDAFPDGEPAWSPDGSRIAYESFRSGQTDLWLIAPNGSGQVQLTHTAVSERDPTWSPDGTRLAFGGFGDIYVMAAIPDSPPTKLTANPFDDSNPDWSPDGTKIAYTANSAPGDGMGGADHLYEITVMNADGTSPTAVTHDDEFDLEPAWSPDGSRLVYTIGTFSGELVTISSSGGDQQPLVPGSLSPGDADW